MGAGAENGANSFDWQFICEIQTLALMRRAEKAGSWYPGDGEELLKMISSWMSKITCTSKNPKVLIVPHAGFRYSGFTASHSYNLLTAKKPLKILLLHPSHHKHLETVRQCPFETIETPLGTLRVDKIEGIQENSMAVDQSEHSAELQFPFLKYLNVESVCSVMVGTKWSEQDVESLTKYLELNPSTVIVVSSDFCHYGPNYGFQIKDFDSLKIEEMDLLGFECIKSKNVRKFSDYLSTTGNTICGRNAILLAMQLINNIYPDGEWTLLHYSQSSNLKSDPNSVSYLAAVYE